MRSLLAGILIFTVLVTNFRTINTYAWFLYNQDYIAEILCINKEKPSMHCDGKCFLMQQLATQDSSNDQNSQVPGAEERPIFLFYNGYIAKDLSSVDHIDRNEMLKINEQLLPSDFCRGLFRPPKC